ncbi:chromosomal replication initiator protein DnaA [Candidatus Wolfebacteria bacterium]|nr:chromosomal replication initiator protein DnaA [Candidatus Wolfebacteria bacterium]
MEILELWQSTLGELELQISRANFLTWLKNSSLLTKDEQGIALIGLPNNFAKEWVQAKYHKLILSTLQSIDESVRKVEYAVVDEKKQIFRVEFKRTTDEERQMSLPEFKIDPETNLNPKYTLNSFIVGSANELAYAAAMAIVKDVGKKYNPYFVYGGTGLGKTHLLQSVGNEIKNRYKGKVRVRYVPSEKFVNDVVWAIRNKRMEDIKNKYRNADVLIVDDIQFIGGKERSEEEFFHTFNVLYENSKQIIISSDRPPAAIPTLEARLRSRFEGGIITDVSYPDYEMRVAIIKTKLQEKNSDLPDEVCELISKKVQRNIREIEGILNKILFHKEVRGVEPTVKVAEEIISNIIQQSAKNITPPQVIKAVADFFEITPNDFINRSRKKGVVEPRQITAFLLRELLGMSYPDIGEKLGKRDHSTVIHSYEKISKELNKNQSLNQKIILIKEAVYKN